MTCYLSSLDGCRGSGTPSHFLIDFSQRHRLSVFLIHITVITEQGLHNPQSQWHDFMYFTFSLHTVRVCFPFIRTQLFEVSSSAKAYKFCLLLLPILL